MHGRSHPLVGRVRAVASGRLLDAEALYDALARHDVVLLGERHDHPDHHRLQRRALEALVARGRRPAVAFEMLDADDAAALAEAAAGPGSPAARAEAVGRAVGWDASGWPPFALYAPIFEAALAAELPLVAANLAPATVRAIGRAGVEALPPAERRRLGLDAAPDPDERAILEERIAAAHCGHVPAAALGGMVAVQRAWNAALAAALADALARGADGAVLIAGVEHVRRDVGVPRWLARRAPHATLAAVALLEVDPERPDADPAGAFGDPPPFDYVWYTPRLDLEDPCQRFREQLEGLERR